MDVVIHILAWIGGISVGMFIIGGFLTTSQDNEKIAKVAIGGIRASKRLTYKQLWQHVHGDKEIICLEDLTYEQMIELIVAGNKL